MLYGFIITALPILCNDEHYLQTISNGFFIFQSRILLDRIMGKIDVGLIVNHSSCGPDSSCNDTDQKKSCAQSLSSALKNRVTIYYSDHEFTVIFLSPLMD